MFDTPAFPMQALRERLPRPAPSFMPAVCALVGLAIVLSAPGRLMGQGPTGAAVQGAIVGTDSVAVTEATVLVTNTSTGERWQTVTGGNGRFFLEHLSVGGPYRLDVRAIGFTPAERSGVFLSLGQRATFDVALVPTVFQLEEVSVNAVADARINSGRTGPAMTVSDSTIVRLPVDGRDFTRLALLSPQVTPSADGGLSFAGQHDRLNSLQVDGTTDNGIRGDGVTGVFGIPGDQNSFGRFALVPEAVRELQIITAPFDVRYGNFAGGLVNAVSRSGSNRWEGSLFSYLDSPELAGHNPDGTLQDPFTRQEFGLTLGGPIVRDRLAFFLSAGGRRQVFPQRTPGPGRDTTGGADSVGSGIRYATVTRFQDILRNTYGVDPGTFESTPGRVPTRTVFAKVTAQLGINSRLEISQDYFHEDAKFGGEHDYGFLGFSSHGASDIEVLNATRLDWTAAFGPRVTNQLLLAHRSDRHRCITNSNFPTVEAAADAGTVISGEQRGCRQDDFESIWELTNNLELASGSHHLTLGTHDELVHLYDARAFTGGWFFESLDSLAQGVPAGYDILVPGPLIPTGGRPDFSVSQVGFYLQDQWIPSPRLTVTAGLRFDVPFLRTAPPENPELLASPLAISTAHTPGGNLLWSPRLGLNFDPSGKGTTFLRGGIGLFAGRPAYTWLENAFNDAGIGLLYLACDGDNIPAFTLDESAQPTQCADIEVPAPVITVFDPAFRYPRNLKIALGADKQLPWSMVGTVDLLYTRGINQFAERDLNLMPPSGISAGEGGRALYGTIDPTEGFSSPNRRAARFESVAQITNGSGDRSYSVAFQLQKRFAGGTEVSAAYTYTNAKDRADSPGNSGRGNLGDSPLDGTWESPNLRTALWSRPHKLTLFGTADLPLKVRLGLSYLGYSGDPLTYIVHGDANADGLDNLDDFRHNDPVYVPRDATDITLDDPADYARLDRYIQTEGCLQAQRGRLLQRNSCRNPWINRLDARLTKVLPTGRGQSVEIAADLFNLLNFIDHDWGQVRQTTEESGGGTNGNRVSLVQLVGYDVANSRGIYHVLEPRRNELQVEPTRWRMQLSARYTF
jgi:outer membrane receptor protein involved in Fe transport